VVLVRLLLQAEEGSGPFSKVASSMVLLVASSSLGIVVVLVASSS
jgi:hypothetical protein